MDAHAKILVSGRVQGVGFRFFTLKEAQVRGLSGTARNLIDGRVEITVEGEKGLIHEFINRLKVGPRLSDVKDVDVEFSEYKNEFNTFRIL